MLTEEAEDRGGPLEDLWMGALAKECLCDLFPHDVLPQERLIEVVGGANFLAFCPDDVRERPLELDPHVDGLLTLPLENYPRVDPLEKPSEVAHPFEPFL
jgi:hypothetical protein